MGPGRKILIDAFHFRVLPSRSTAEIELTLESPVCVEIFVVCKALGRFVLRSGAESIAGGTITGVSLPIMFNNKYPLKPCLQYVFQHRCKFRLFYFIDLPVIMLP